ncbi:MAG: SpoIIE family protein phosphatase [Anaerolineales bacterium]|jgi:serine phosphatase RsbU (regulator of sigma subunit)|nr:SpoIIE family protein phosphatase [Anaerolineales bacterium]
MAVQSPLHIAIASESAIIRRGLISMLQSASHVKLVAEAHNLSDAMKICTESKPDVLLVHFHGIPEATSELVRQIRLALPYLRVILLMEEVSTFTDQQSGAETGISALSLRVTEEEFLEMLSRLGAQQKSGHPSSDRSRSSTAMAQELAMAGQVQANILPEKVPELPGWEIAARLLPARETSGDFYDFIPVTDKNWGIIIADVADKGIGAALFMTLTSTLFRGLAPRHPSLPALTLQTVNERILSDTRGSMFVTAFYGVLEPNTGRFRFSNAGHPPPLLVKSQKGKPIDRLGRTGMALGVQDNEYWSQKLVVLAPGDVLVLYTDGVIEAQNPQGRFFDIPRLQDVVQKVTGRSAKVILDAILTEVHRFTAGVPAQDDTAILVIRRKENS